VREQAAFEAGDRVAAAGELKAVVAAAGEVVVVEGNYGVRVQEIVSRAQRLQTTAEPQVEE